MAFPTYHVRKVTHALWALLPILLALLLSVTQPVAAKEAEITSNGLISAQASDVFLVVNPATSSVNQGDTFVVTIEVQAGTQEINGASAYLDFDPSLLQVQSMTPVSPLSIEFQNTFDNSTGQIDYAVASLSAPYATGTFDLLQVEFQALADTPNTTLAFHTSDPRNSDLTSASTSGSVLTGTTDGTVVVGGGPASLDADFSCTPLSGSAPLAVTCSDSSTGNVTGWAWDFGDGTTSSDQNPTHTYNMTGTHTIGLIVTGPDGSDTESKADYISVSDSLEEVTLNLISAGELTRQTNPIIFSETIADVDVLSVAITETWRTTDTTNLGQGWHLTLQATDHLRGSQEPANRVIPVGTTGGFQIQCSDAQIVKLAGPPTANLPTCSTTTFQPIPIAGEGPLTILSAAANEGMGVYDFIPNFELLIPGYTIVDTYTTSINVAIIAGP